MHIELDALEIFLIITWWVASKWVARLVFVGVVAKIIANIMQRAGDKIESKMQKFGVGVGKTEVNGAEEKQNGERN
jgi:hypothetical protein